MVIVVLCLNGQFPFGESESTEKGLRVKIRRRLSPGGESSLQEKGGHIEITYRGETPGVLCRKTLAMVYQSVFWKLYTSVL